MAGEAGKVVVRERVEDFFRDPDGALAGVG